MLVNLSDGRCRECGGQLDITDVDDVSMLVECKRCGDVYQIEPDALGAGCATYYLDMVTRKFQKGDPYVS